ncbi:MAG: hypothetical protein U0R50_15865 [Gaiellales bacterium]
MLGRAQVVALTVPLVGLSVLAGHAVAYAVTGADPEPLHGYLDHAAQVMVLAVFALLVLGVGEQRFGGGLRLLPWLAPAVFAGQEHLERYVHTGDLPLLATDRTFLLGLALQVPAALLVARLAGTLARELGCRAESSSPPRLWLLAAAPIPTRSAFRPAPLRPGLHAPRGPPQ